ncbi:MAG: nuclear transport factor 2 family protein [Bacteroidetes bacterium]|nr:nuclear transport factor 2 family protein [Bacteroidota bacterium]MDA1121237.1 nuclear transport factor 2 family protein [Bacteroidota bacterium]
MKTFIKIISAGIIFTNYSCSAPGEQVAQSEEPVVVTPSGPIISAEQSKAVIEHHLNAFGMNDIRGIMADYSDESVVVTADSTFTGLASIEAFFTQLLPSFPTEGTSIELDKFVVKNELVYIIWHGSSPTLNVPFGTDTFIVEDDKIKRQTFAGVINPAE